MLAEYRTVQCTALNDVDDNAHMSLTSLTLLFRKVLVVQFKVQFACLSQYSIPTLLRRQAPFSTADSSFIARELETVIQVRVIFHLTSKRRLKRNVQNPTSYTLPVLDARHTVIGVVNTSAQSLITVQHEIAIRPLSQFPSPRYPGPELTILVTPPHSSKGRSRQDILGIGKISPIRG